MTHKKQRSSSLFGPIVLITVGVLWLLSNLGFLQPANIDYLVRFWPLLLIFGGLNLIVRQLPSPLGTLLSGFMGLLAVGTLLFLLFLMPATFRTGAAVEYGMVQNRPISVPLGDTQRASVEINLDRWPVALSALSGSSDLLNGTVSYQGELDLSESRRGGQTNLRLGVRHAPPFYFSWFSGQPLSEEDGWQIGLNRTVPLDLTLNAGSGVATLGLEALQLEKFTLNSGSGRVLLTSPPGSYDGQINSGSGTLEWYPAADTQGEWRLNSGSGTVRIHLPAGVPVRIELRQGSGGVEVDQRLEQVRGMAGMQVWESADYATAPARLLLIINSGSGSVTIQPASGR